MTNHPRPPGRPTFLAHPILSITTLAYLGLVGWMTLGPQPNSALFRAGAHLAIRVLDRLGLEGSYSQSQLEFGANIAMFVPIGLFFCLLFGARRWWLALIVAMWMTCAIEVTQLLIPGRVFDVRDLVSNSIGAIIGIGVVLLASIGSRRGARSATSATSAAH